ncbi:MAG: hypothetical protein EBZ77_03450 [Chitinophagia bacterium]|nr:hypothetical protein [Chitinophagia bacterium]
MKKGLLYIITILFCGAAFTSCIQNGKDRTITSSMKATVGKASAIVGTFTANTTTPAVITPQLSDSATTLVITGYNATTNEQVVLTIYKYKSTSGTFSIVNGEALAVYNHNGTSSVANGGVVAIKEVRASEIVGYFSFTTVDGYAISAGDFSVGRPWNF